MGYILGITFAVTDIPNLLSKENDAGGYAIAQIFYEVFKNRYGNGAGGIVCLGIVAVAVFFCGMSSLTSNSRCRYLINVKFCFFLTDIPNLYYLNIKLIAGWVMHSQEMELCLFQPFGTK